jgi:multiple sugar transport system substrate-binding protein
VAGKFDVVALPQFEGRSAASVLGGDNLAISSTSRWPDLTWDAIQCLSDERSQREKAVERGFLPTLGSLYEDAAVKEAMPFIEQSRAALESGVNRPVSPYYGDITIAIYRAWNDVAAGRISPEDAVARMDTSIQRALDGKAEI